MVIVDQQDVLAGNAIINPREISAERYLLSVIPEKERPQVLQFVQFMDNLQQFRGWWDIMRSPWDISVFAVGTMGEGATKGEQPTSIDLVVQSAACLGDREAAAEYLYNEVFKFFCQRDEKFEFGNGDKRVLYEDFGKYATVYQGVFNKDHGIYFKNSPKDRLPLHVQIPVGVDASFEQLVKEREGGKPLSVLLHGEYRPLRNYARFLR